LGKPTEELGWYEPHLQISLNWINDLCLEKNSRIVDIGGGASTLVDDLLNNGFKQISVLDLSDRALSTVKARLGKRAKLINWHKGDITSIDLPTHYYDLWHDRAVFHFLTDHEQQQQYRDNLLHALQPDGHVIMATFAPEAPPRCSGLPISRYSPEQLSKVLGKEFKLNQHKKELHITPGGVEQMYLYCQFKRLA
jgi:SAM-dependent methyltransferase